jgi:hypothetical protein
MAVTGALARGDTKHPGIITGDAGRGQDPGWMVFQVLNSSGNLVDPARIVTHPSFDAVEGEGILTYDTNPDITRGFIFSPATLVETNILKTLKGSVVIKFGQDASDVVVTETWRGGGNRLSVLSEMFHTFYKFWTTDPEPGQFLVWQPQDLSVESFGVDLVNVQLGPANAIEFREYRSDITTSVDSYQAKTLVVQYKIVTEGTAPKGTITLEGL